MLLQRLREYGARLDDLGPPRYKRTPIRYQVELDANGHYLGMVTLVGDATRKNDRGKPLMVPTRPRQAPKYPILFADNGEYTFGRARADEGLDTAAANHASYRELMAKCALETDDPAVLAVATFLSEHDLDSLDLGTNYNPKESVTFSVNGVRPADLEVVQRFWARYMGVGQDTGARSESQCLICGDHKPVLERVPLKIKGIPGGQSAGTSLISADKGAFQSFGLDNSRTSPVCEECSELFSKALNSLLEGAATHLRVPPLVYAYWTRSGAAFDVGTLLSDAKPDDVRAFLTAPFTGRTGALGLETDAFYAVALGASGGRAVVRDWLDATLPEVHARLRRYFQLQQLVGEDGSTWAPQPLWRLVGATLRDRRPGDRQEEPAPVVPQALLRLALAGGPLPESLLARTIDRLRAGNRLNAARATLVKMVLTSGDARLEEQEDWMVQLDPGLDDAAYRCGRLLAVLDSIQTSALGATNATIIDRFFGTASSAPATVYGRLVRGASHTWPSYATPEGARTWHCKQGWKR